MNDNLNEYLTIIALQAWSSTAEKWLGRWACIRHAVSNSDGPIICVQFHYCGPEGNPFMAWSHLMAKIHCLWSHYHPPKAQWILPLWQALQGSANYFGQVFLSLCSCIFIWYHIRTIWQTTTLMFNITY